MKIRDLIKRIEDDGWRLARTKGSHRQYHHPSKPGTVTVAGHPSDEFAAGNAQQHIEASGVELKYLVIYEKSPTGWGAFVPDLPGLGVAGSTLEEVKKLIREGIEFHIEGMKLNGDPIPQPSVQTEYVSVEAG
jgi:predicted RNA binding protein YcfA (HicA-like mRNA interferase family)/predicted RNase H-like HicB family nuclease